MAGKNIVFIDIDGTLLNTKNRYHVHERDVAAVRVEMRKLARRGFLFGLNSNRSVSDMLPIYRKFGFNGPLAAENGLLVKPSAGQKVTALLGRNDLMTIHKTKLEFQRAVLSYLVDSYKRKVVWLETDTVAALKRRRGFNYADGTLLVLNTKSRVYTTSLYMKIVRRKKLVEARQMMSELEMHMKALFKDRKDFTIVTSQFGNMLFYTSAVSKRTAVEWLKEKYGDCDIYAIGDEEGDRGMVDDLGRFMAVGNASSALRRRAYASSKHKYSRGVTDLLRVLEATTSGCAEQARRRAS